MKKFISTTTISRVPLLLLILIFCILSCKKETDKITNETKEPFPQKIKSFLTQSMLDSLRNAGAVINSGTTPPIVNGIYLMSPDSCIFDNMSPTAGTLYGDYRFKFSNQDNTADTLTVEQKLVATGLTHQLPVFSYISGSGTKFSIFLYRNVSAMGITVEQYNVLSGTWTAAGIQNLQNSLYIRNKGDDPDNKVAKAGTIRVFVTGRSGLAVNTPIF
ncbi:MAG TPA: hypothetical protein PLK15_01245 [Chitinophagales bacterium]|jgi:hypothetical protein|nr:hypothetical protein [Chitinophagales bacterium]